MSASLLFESVQLQRHSHAHNLIILPSVKTQVSVCVWTGRRTVCKCSCSAVFIALMVI